MQIKELDTEMVAWADGTRHYETEDGKFLAVEATLVGDDVVPIGAQPMIDEVVSLIGQGRKIEKIVIRPTVVFPCNAEGFATDLTPIATFEAGTTHEQALTEMGYEIT